MSGPHRQYLAVNEVLDIQEMDEEHNELFKRLENLKEHSFGNQALLREEADNLLEYLTQHFRTEQNLAEKAGIDFAAHAQIHEKMLGVVSLALNEFYLGNGDIFGLIKYIHLWFTRHIRETDSRFAEKLRNLS